MFDWLLLATMNNQSFGSGSPKSFHAYPRGDFDLESGILRKSFRKPKSSTLIRMIKSIPNRIHHFYKLHPVAVFLSSLSLGVTILVVLSVFESRIRMMGFRRSDEESLSSYPLPDLHNLVMVAGHSVYTSTSCGKDDSEDSWFLEPYQKKQGQAATFLEHIRKGIESAAADEKALLLFSGGETRKDAGPRSEAQSYWSVAESEDWFGHQDSVRSRALTEEHARDSFENLLFSVCRFRELTGSYPQNITMSYQLRYPFMRQMPLLLLAFETAVELQELYAIEVVSYDFKKERFAHLHRLAIGFPEVSFSYIGTPAAPGSQEAAEKGEAYVRSQFQEDPYGCLGSLHRKRIKRDPFHRITPYPSGCPELKGLFSYCGSVPYPGELPWSQYSQG